MYAKLNEEDEVKEYKIFTNKGESDHVFTVSSWLEAVDIMFEDRESDD